MLSGKCWPFCLSLSVLRKIWHENLSHIDGPLFRFRRGVCYNSFFLYNIQAELNWCSSCYYDQWMWSIIPQDDDEVTMNECHDALLMNGHPQSDELTRNKHLLCHRDLQHLCFLYGRYLVRKKLLPFTGHLWGKAPFKAASPHRGAVIWSLTHWGLDKMAAIFHTTFSNAFPWMKMYKFRLRIHWSLFPGV